MGNREYEHETMPCGVGDRSARRYPRVDHGRTVDARVVVVIGDTAQNVLRVAEVGGDPLSHGIVSGVAIKIGIRALGKDSEIEWSSMDDHKFLLSSIDGFGKHPIWNGFVMVWAILTVGSKPFARGGVASPWRPGSIYACSGCRLRKTSYLATG